VAVKIEVMVFWVVKLASVWRWRQHSPPDGIVPCHCMVLQPRRLWL